MTVNKKNAGGREADGEEKQEEWDVEERERKGGVRWWSNKWFWVAGILVAYLLGTRMYDLKVSLTPKSGQQAEVSSGVGQGGSEKTGVKSAPTGSQAQGQSASQVSGLQEQVLPSKGVEVPIKWGDLGKQLVAKGVIDEQKFKQLFGGSLPDEQEAMLTGSWDGPIVIDNQNSRFLLDLWWALGLANKNSILTAGEMSNPQYGGAGNFASTGGWTLAKGDAMNYYSKYELVKLTAEQQGAVDRVSSGIYRPCCGNSTHFPDCNHGMAMLGLLELMASQGASEDQMYKTALAVNSYWFPQTYLDLATYFSEQGQTWGKVDPKIVLGQAYSSSQGYQATKAKIQSQPKVQSGGGGCGV